MSSVVICNIHPSQLDYITNKTKTLRSLKKRYKLSQCEVLDSELSITLYGDGDAVCSARQDVLRTLKSLHTITRKQNQAVASILRTTEGWEECLRVCRNIAAGVALDEQSHLVVSSHTTQSAEEVFNRIESIVCEFSYPLRICDHQALSTSSWRAVKQRLQSLLYHAQIVESLRGLKLDVACLSSLRDDVIFELHNVFVKDRAAWEFNPSDTSSNEENNLNQPSQFAAVKVLNSIPAAVEFSYCNLESSVMDAQSIDSVTELGAENKPSGSEDRAKLTVVSTPNLVVHGQNTPTGSDHESLGCDDSPSTAALQETLLIPVVKIAVSEDKKINSNLFFSSSASEIPNAVTAPDTIDCAGPSTVMPKVSAIQEVPLAEQKSTNIGGVPHDRLRGNRRHTQVVNVHDFMLHTTENPWKRGNLMMDTQLYPEEKEHMELVGAYRGILNKITPQNFQSLLDKVLALPLKTEKDLNGIMNLVYEKAINEPGFSVTYANLCQRIAKEFTVPTEKDQNEMANFRKLLLVRCQREFEKSDSDDNEMITMKTTLDHASLDDQVRLTEEYNLFCTKARQRKLGNIRFVGELFKLQMLVPKVLHECVMVLLKGADEENLECLCCLLQTIGRELDTVNAKPRTDQYFKMMKEIIDGKKVCARVRFALQDVLDLRESNWKPRRENNNPKTIKKIHAEAALEAHEKQMMIDKVQSSNRGNAAKLRASTDHALAARRGQDDGWSNVGGTMGGRPQRIEPGKLRLTKQSAAEEVQLGPAGSLSNWGKARLESSKNTPPQQEDRPSTPTNRYSALSGGSAGSEPEPRSHSGQRFPTGRGSKRQNNPMNRPVGRMSITPRGSVEKDKERASALAAVKNVTTQPGHSRWPSWDISADGRAIVPSAAPGTLPRSSSLVDLPSINKIELKKRIEGILEEYLHSGDIEECISCVRELGPQNCSDLVTELSVMAVLERSQKARRLTGVFLAQLISRDIISVADHIKGLHSQLQYAEDLATDIPKLWSYLAEIITPMFISSSNKTTDLSLLQEVCLPLKDFGKAAVFAAAVLEEASHKIGNSAASDSWWSNGVRWQDFLDEAENEAEFIATHTRPPSMPWAIPPSGSPTPSQNPITVNTPPQMYQPMQAPTTMWTTQSIMGQQQTINPGQPMSNWISRLENNNPKTIKKIHAEASLEAHEKQMMIDKVQIPNRDSAAKSRASTDCPVAPRRDWSSLFDCKARLESEKKTPPQQEERPLHVLKPFRPKAHEVPSNAERDHSRVQVPPPPHSKD